MFSWYASHAFSKRLWNSRSRPYYYWYHFCFYIPHALYFYCKVFIFLNLLGLFLISFLSPEIATSINMHVHLSLSRIIMSGLFLRIVLPVCTCWFHNMVTLHLDLFLLILADLLLLLWKSNVTSDQNAGIRWGNRLIPQILKFIFVQVSYFIDSVKWKTLIYTSFSFETELGTPA